MNIRISKQLAKNTLMTAALCAMLLGSFVYIISPSVAIGTVIVLFIGPIYLFNFFKTKQKSGATVFLLLLLGGLVILSIVALLVNPIYSNAQYLKAFGFSFLSLPIIAITLARRPGAINWAVVWYAAIIFIFAVAQITYIYFGVGLDPARLDSAQYVIDNLVGYVGPRSIFSNPNDFAAVCLLIVIYFLFKSSISEIWKNFITLVSSAMVLFSGSRICIASLILLLVAYYLKDWAKFGRAALVASVGGIIIVAFTGFGIQSFGDSYWFNKLLSFEDLILYYIGMGAGRIADGSADVRISTYAEFLSNIGSIGVGSFKAQDYSYFLSDVLMREDPHSLMVELGLLYGYFGLLIYILILVWIYVSARRRQERWTSMVLTFIVAMLTFTSSSMVNFPAFWVLLFMIFSLPPIVDSKYKRTTH